MLALLAILASNGCQFGGYVPPEDEAPPLEIRTLPLPLGETSHQELNCPEGNCQVRYRMMIERPGELVVSLQPRHSGDNIGIIMVLQDSIGRVLDRYNMQDVKPPLIVKGPVQPGPHTVLVQAIGGRLTYEISAQLAAGGRLELPARPARPLQPAAPTRAAYGSDSAFDPHFDFRPLRHYAFADDPGERFATAEAGRPVANPFLDRQIQLGLQAELAERGFLLVPLEQADFLVDHSASGQSTTWYSFNGLAQAAPYDFYFRQWAGRGGAITPHSYRDGTLTVDMIEAKNGDLIWHGWSTSPVNQYDDQKEIIRGFVKEVLDEFPPR